MKKYILIVFVLLSFLLDSSAQVLETKNWCLTKCDIVGDEKTNTELAYLKLKNDSIINSTERNKIPLRIGIIQEDSIDVEIKEIKVRRAIENLNKSFEATNLVFYILRTD